MSAPKSAARRVALFTSSSFVAASIAALAFTGTTLAPAQALAADECGALDGNPATADTVVCDDPIGTYTGGVTYASDGDLTVTSTVDANEFGGSGIVLTATGDDSVTFDSSGAEIEGRSLNGALVDILTDAGSIVVRTEEVDADAHSAANATHGIRAISTVGGDISIDTTGHVAVSGATAGQAAIEARSTGGDGDIVINTQSVAGRLYGIRAQASGSGDVTINLTSEAVNSSASGTIAGIDVTMGAGELNLTAAGVVGGLGPDATGHALRINTGGDANIEINRLRGLGGVNAIVDLTTTAGTQTTLTHFDIVPTTDSNIRTNALAIRAVGGGNIAVNTNGLAQGRADFSTHTGTLDWMINGQWNSAGGTFGSGDDTLEVGPNGFLVLTHAVPISSGVGDAGDPNSLEPAQVLDFGAGENVLVNRGFLNLGNMRAQGGDDYDDLAIYESETRLMGLDTFENHGTVVLGQPARPGEHVNNTEPEDFYDETDLTTDDVLIMPGTRFVGEEGSRIVLDVRLTGNQAACDVALRSTAVAGSLDGSMPGADCVNIAGGSTEGVTSVDLRTAALGDRGGPVRIVLVDVAGGTSDAGHFVLDSNTLGYTADQGGYIDLGYFIMPLVYDPDTQQHLLVGVTGQNAWQQAAWAQAAHDLWRVTTGSWLDRQADLRGSDMDGVGGGVWLRVNGQNSERDLTNTVSAGASTFTFDNSYEQTSYAITGGLDLLVGGGADSAWVVGLTAGYANAEVTYAESPNIAQLDGWTGGAYASFVSGGLFVDGLVHANRLEMIADVPGLNLSPAGTLLDTRLLSVGGQVEAGWRFGFGGGAFVEPLAGVSYVRTEWDEMNVPSDDLIREGVMVDFGDPVSLRASLGARLGLDQDFGAYRAQYSLLARVWEEFEGETDLTLDTIVDDAFVSDEFAGQVSELSLGASLSGDIVSAFVNVGGKWGDDYQATSGAVGVRVAW